MTVKLDFAPGTTEDCQRIVQKIQPGHLYDAYRLGRTRYDTSDVVLVVNEDDLETINAWTRSRYVEHALRGNSPGQLATLAIASKSAHQIMQLPRESDAFWLVVEIRALQFPVMCVLYASRHLSDGGSVTIVS